MTNVHYYLGRPAHVWIAANSRPAPHGKRIKAADASAAVSRASPRADSPLLCLLWRTAQPMLTRAAPGTGSPP